VDAGFGCRLGTKKAWSVIDRGAGIAVEKALPAFEPNFWGRAAETLLGPNGRRGNWNRFAAIQAGPSERRPSYAILEDPLAKLCPITRSA